MSSRDLNAWMWSEACELLEQAERLHQQFFRLGDRAGRHPVWEPPVDVFESEEEFLIVVALPGVPEHRIEVSVDAGMLVIRAARDVPFGGGSVTLRRLEIPHGYFERRIQLPQMPLRLHAQEVANGCLVLSLRKSG
jgi:HSP20 family molecular chaperone IbpA